MGNPRTIAGVHATHSLVRASYLERGTVDSPGLMWEGYAHNFADDEFVETAKARGAFVHATDSIVEHFHPAWEKAEMDETYINYALNGPLFDQDQQKFNQRCPMWRKAHRDTPNSGVPRASVARA